MRFWLTRDSRSFIAAAMLSTGLAACSSGTPTAPSALSAGDVAPNAVTTSVSSTTVPTSTAQATAADTIKITQGTLAIRSLFAGTMTLRGSHGFRFDGSTAAGAEPSFNCGPFNPCQPGATVAFTEGWLGSELSGTVRVQGDEYPLGLVASSMFIELTGSFVAPAHVSDTASVTVPFAVSGSVYRADPDPLPALQLTGRGQVTFSFEWQPLIDGWAIRFATFDFGGGPHSS
jgi:hypothetical protein